MSSSLNSFIQLTKWVDQLAQIHTKINSGPGRRHNQEALYRAGVVMTIAAWESYVEDLLNEAFLALTPAPGSKVGEISSWNFAKNLASTATKKFNTPNANNVALLYQDHLGVDVTAAWGVSRKTGPYLATESEKRINNWLDIRHKIAHGGSLPTKITWIQDPKKNPRLTLALMKEVQLFFSEIVENMDSFVANEISTKYGLPSKPW